MTGNQTCIHNAREILGLPRQPAGGQATLTDSNYQQVSSALNAPVEAARQHFISQIMRHMTQGAHGSRDLNRLTVENIRNARVLAEGLRWISNRQLMENMLSIHQQIAGPSGNLSENTVFVAFNRHGRNEVESSHSILEMYRTANNLTGSQHNHHFGDLQATIRRLQNGERLNIVLLNDGIGSGEEAARMLHIFRALTRSDVPVDRAVTILRQLGIGSSNTERTDIIRQIRSHQRENPSTITYATAVGSMYGSARLPALLEHLRTHPDGLNAQFNHNPRVVTHQATLPEGMRVITAERPFSVIAPLREALDPATIRMLLANPQQLALVPETMAGLAQYLLSPTQRILWLGRQLPLRQSQFQNRWLALPSGHVFEHMTPNTTLNPELRRLLRDAQQAPTPQANQ